MRLMVECGLKTVFFFSFRLSYLFLAERTALNDQIIPSYFVFRFPPPPPPPERVLINVSFKTCCVDVKQKHLVQYLASSLVRAGENFCCKKFSTKTPERSVYTFRLTVRVFALSCFYVCVVFRDLLPSLSTPFLPIRLFLVFKHVKKTQA